MSDYLKPKVKTAQMERKMQNGMFRNPPTYTELGGFSSSRKYTDPSGKRGTVTGMALERGGPTAQRGKPI
jgi:hypothetical protein